MTSTCSIPQVRVLVVAGLLALFAGGASAQTHKDTRVGFQIKPPKSFEALPVQPGARLQVARFKDTKQSTTSSGSFYNTMDVSFYPSTRMLSGQSEDEFFDQLVDQFERANGYCEIDKDKDTKVDRSPARERFLIPEKGEFSEYQLFIRQEDGVFVVTGTALKDRFDKDSRDFSKAGKSFKRIEKEALEEAEGGDRSQMDEQERFLQEQIDKLPRGWDHLRTDRYLFLFNAEKTFVKEMADQIEAIRDVYEDLYPPDREITAVSIVRVCDSRDDYMGYGGSAGSAGYWSPRARELVFYDADPRDLTLAVLNHEAFHQYIYYFYGELSPHSWYNEGHGDYFAGAKMTRSYRVKAFDDAPGGVARKQTAKTACMMRGQGKEPSEGGATPLKDLMRYSQAEYYRDGGKHYAQGWALVHFLREGKRLPDKWDRILPEYLDNLLAARHEVATEVMQRELDKWESTKQGDKPSEDPTGYYNRADVNDVQALAYEKTFATWSDEDWDAFDEAYREYVEKL